MHLNMLSAEVVCCKLLPNITDKLSLEANSVDPEQTAPIKEQSDLGPHCLPWRLLKHFSRREKQTTFVAIGTLRVKALHTVWHQVSQPLNNSLSEATLSCIKRVLCCILRKSTFRFQLTFGINHKSGAKVSIRPQRWSLAG